MTISQPRIAVIGAGCSGLATVKMLLEEGFTQVVCFEKSDHLGGNWAYSPEPGHSSVMETTHLISSKTLSQFRDFPMPADYPDFPSHRQILAYFEAYAERFGLKKYIRFGVWVELVSPVDEGKAWDISFSDGNTERFDYVFVANGHHSVPRHPEWRSDFTGTYLHVHDLKTAEGLKGKNVLVVGAGNSGCDCAVEASRVAQKTEMSIRTPQYIVPKLFMGRPTDTFSQKMDWVPWFIKHRLQKLALRIQVGDYRGYGLVWPDFPVTFSHPSVSSELLEKIRHGKVKVRPGIARIEGQKVWFNDGASAEFDTLIAATGYKISFPFLSPEIAAWEDATNIPLYLRMFHPGYPSLIFIGLVQPQGSVWPLSEAQARLAARVISGRKKLPGNWRAEAVREGESIERRFLKRPRHSLEVHYRPYLGKLESLAGL